MGSPKNKEYNYYIISEEFKLIAVWPQAKKTAAHRRGKTKNVDEKKVDKIFRKSGNFAAVSWSW